MDIPGITSEKVLSYIEVLRERKPVGQRVAIIGAGEIGFDTAEYLAAMKVKVAVLHLKNSME